MGFAERFTRKLELLRGRLLVLRGANAGALFGLGPGVEIVGASCLTAGDRVTIARLGYLNCISERGVRIGDDSSIDQGVWLHCGGNADGGHGGWVEIGSHSYIGPNAVIGAGGGIDIGNDVLMGARVTLHAESHLFADAERPIREQGITRSGITIQDDVWIGSGAVILDGVVVGHGAVIGAGAVVNRDVPPLAVVVGVPARVVSCRGTA